MPGRQSRESVVDTGFETPEERIARIQGIFNDLRNEARWDVESAKIIKVEANALQRMIGSDELDEDE